MAKLTLVALIVGSAALYGCADPAVHDTTADVGSSHDAHTTLDSAVPNGPDVADDGIADDGIVEDQGAAQDAAEDHDVVEHDECLTGGAGGLIGRHENERFTDSEGLESAYHLYADAIDTSAPVGLAIFAHGDGGYSFDNPTWITRDLAARAQASNLLFLAIATPTPANGRTWWREGQRNAQWVREFLQTAIFPSYNIDRRRVLLLGYSGGALFTSQHMTPTHSDLFCGGGFIAYGGGQGPRPADERPFAPSFLADFRPHFYTGMEDTGCAPCSCDGYNAYADAQRGEQWYRDAGFHTTAQFPEGIHHCNIDFAEVLDEQLNGGLIPASSR